MDTVTVDDLRSAELDIKRAVGRVETRRKRLAEEEAALLQARERHADLVKAYGQQHCPGETSA